MSLVVIKDQRLIFLTTGSCQCRLLTLIRMNCKASQIKHARLLRSSNNNKTTIVVQIISNWVATNNESFVIRNLTTKHREGVWTFLSCVCIMTAMPVREYHMKYRSRPRSRPWRQPVRDELHSSPLIRTATRLMTWQTGAGLPVTAWCAQPLNNLSFWWPGHHTSWCHRHDPHFFGHCTWIFCFPVVCTSCLPTRCE